MILHWLGPTFDPALAGYWGSADLDAAADTVLALIDEHAGKVDGIKVSLLDDGLEVALRRRLPAGVRLYTGDDFNYPELIRGRRAGPLRRAARHLRRDRARRPPRRCAALDAGDLGGVRPDPRRRRCRWPGTCSGRRPSTTRPGIVFLAWLAGHQDHFTMVGGAAESAGRRAHLAELLRLADAAGLLPDAELAAAPGPGLLRRRPG